MGRDAGPAAAARAAGVTKCTLHAHGPGGGLSRGVRSYEQMAEELRAAGYEWAAVVEHDAAAPAAAVAAAAAAVRGVVLVPAEERRRGAVHMTEGAPLRVAQHPAADGASSSGGSSRLSVGDVRRCGADAIEVYNHWGALSGNGAVAEKLWDACLTDGMRLWGVADDDSFLRHPQRGWMAGIGRPGHIAPGGGWVVARARGAAAVAAALRAGDFYSSTGIDLADWRADAGAAGVTWRLRVSGGAAAAAEAVVTGGGGRTLARARCGAGGEISLDVPWDGAGGYQRCTVSAEGQRAWMQPVWRNAAPATARM